MNEEKYCDNCQHEDIDIDGYPCDICSRDTDFYWMAKLKPMGIDAIMSELVKVFKFTIYKGIGTLYEMHHDEEKLISFAQLAHYPEEVRKHYNIPPMKCGRCLSENIHMEAGLIYCSDCKQWSEDKRNQPLTQNIKQENETDV